jgi:hypothetical protein
MELIQRVRSLAGYEFFWRNCMLSKQLRPALFAAVLVITPALYAQSYTYPITQDTYIDSSLPTYNAGSFNKVKAVDNPASVQHPGATSTTRALFYLPAVQSGFWTALDNAISAGETYDVTVNYYAANNSLAGYYQGHVTGSDQRVVELHPMTDSWAVGSANYAPNASGSPGATWNTSDGTTAWTNTASFPTITYNTDGSTSTTTATGVGGDYDVAHSVTDSSGSNSPANGGPFSWDITSLLSGGPGTTTYNELFNYGALLKVNNDTTYDTDNDIQYFLSLNSAEAAAGSTPFVTLTVAPEPAIASSLMALALLAGYNRRRR